MKLDKRQKGFVMYLVLAIGALMLFAAFVVLKYGFSKKSSSATLSKSAVIQNDRVDLTGTIWTSGLSDEEKEILEIDPEFQIVKTPKVESQSNCADKINGMYLISDSVDFAEYQGKCVRISGITLAGWENLADDNYEINGKWTYGRSALVVDSILTVPTQECLIDFDRITEKVDGRLYESFTGKVGFLERPAPDINYDFGLILDTPYLDNNDASGRPSLRQKIDITPGTDEIYMQLIENIDRKVQVHGYWQGGYAESTFFMIEELVVI